MYQLIEKYINDLMVKSTPQLPYWNRESILQGKKPQWNYIDGCMLCSLYDIYRQTKSQPYLVFIKEFIDYYVGNDGLIRGYNVNEYNLDNINEGRVLFDLYDEFKEEKYKKAIDVLYSQLKTQPRNIEGNFWHKLIYPNQVWLDGLYMAQVFYVRYETKFNNKEYYSDIVRQFLNVRKNMFDENKRLYYHGFDITRNAFWANENGLSSNFWLRAIGWYTVALVDVIDYIDDQESKNILTSLLVEDIEGLMNYIDQGMFYQVVDGLKKSGNYLETSGSAMIAYACLKGARIGALDKKYQEIGKTIFDSICKHSLCQLDGQLHLNNICLSAGLGPNTNRKRDGSYDYYVSEPVVCDDAKGVGPFIMAYTELKKYLANG